MFQVYDLIIEDNPKVANTQKMYAVTAHCKMGDQIKELKNSSRAQSCQASSKDANKQNIIFNGGCFSAKRPCCKSCLLLS